MNQNLISISHLDFVVSIILCDAMQFNMKVLFNI